MQQLARERKSPLCAEWDKKVTEPEAMRTEPHYNWIQKQLPRAVLQDNLVLLPIVGREIIIFETTKLAYSKFPS